jgi:hypothetical protein
VTKLRNPRHGIHGVLELVMCKFWGQETLAQDEFEVAAVLLSGSRGIASGAFVVISRNVSGGVTFAVLGRGGCWFLVG